MKYELVLYKISKIKNKEDEYIASCSLYSENDILGLEIHIYYKVEIEKTIIKEKIVFEEFEILDVDNKKAFVTYDLLNDKSKKEIKEKFIYQFQFKILLEEI